MKPDFYLTRLAFVALAATLLSGCLFKTTPAPVRHFLLAPISTNEPIASTERLSIGIAFVKMPAYLLRDSIAVRNGANEIEYLEGALWGERLDQCFQRTLVANLSRLLDSDNIYSSDWARNQVMGRVSINVERFDVDTHGHGTLIAHWRISARDGEAPLKSGTARLSRAGPSANAGAIAVTLSELLGEFSYGVAQSIRENAKNLKQF